MTIPTMAQRETTLFEKGTSARWGPLAAIDAIVFAGLVVLLMFGPLAFGAVEPWAVTLLEFTSALLFGLWAFRQWREMKLTFPAMPLVWPQLAFITLILLQLGFSITDYWYATFSALVLVLVYFFIFVVAAHSFRLEGRLRSAAIAFSTYGFLVAVFAVIQSVTSNGKIYWLRTLEEASVPFGPYVNHNHYAGMMEMLAPIPMAVAFTPAFPRPQRVMAGFAAIVMGGSIFISLSRGGMIAFLAEAFVLWLALHGVRGGRRSVLALAALLAVTASFLFWLNGNQVISRITDIPAQWEADRIAGRSATARDAWAMFKRKPITGFGLDVFPIVYPSFRSYYTNGLVNQAHNDHLQLLVETGLAGYAIMLWFVVQLYRGAWEKIRGGTLPWARVMTAAALAGCTAMLIHAFSDFNFHIPANAALFWAFSAMAGAAPEGQSKVASS